MESNRASPRKRSVVLHGTKTSIGVEDKFWTTLDEIARERKTSRHDLIATIEEQREVGRSLSSAVRIYVLSCVLARKVERSGRYGRPTEQKVGGLSSGAGR